MFVSQHLSKRLPKKRFSCIRFKIPFQKSLRGSILKPKFGLNKLSIALLHGLRNNTDVRGIESQSAIFQHKNYILSNFAKFTLERVKSVQNIYRRCTSGSITLPQNWQLHKKKKKDNGEYKISNL